MLSMMCKNANNMKHLRMCKPTLKVILRCNILMFAQACMTDFHVLINCYLQLHLQ